MKVLIITTIMAPYRVDLFKSIAKQVELTVCFEQYRDNTRDESWYSRNIDGFNFILNEKNRHYKFNQNVKHEIDKGYDYVIFYEYSTKLAINFILYCQRKKVPYLINCDGAFVKKNNFAKYFIKSMLIKGASGLLANGVSAIQYFLYYGANENKIYLHDFTSLNKSDFDNENNNDCEDLFLQYNIPSHGKICLAVGRYIPSKHFEFLIEIWDRVSPECYLLIIGNGIYKDKYIDLIKNNKHSNIRVVSHLNKEKLFKLYRKGKLLLFPVDDEIWGLVVEEAMSQGLPVIGTVGSNAVTELIKNEKNGFILSRDSPSEWVNNINELCLNTNIYRNMSIEAMNSVKERTIENNARQIINILNGLSEG